MPKLNELMKLTVAFTFDAGLIKPHENASTNNTASINYMAVGASRLQYQRTPSTVSKKGVQWRTIAFYCA